MWVLWLILCGVFLIAEIFTVSFLLFWPGIGAFIAFITSLITDNITIQIGIFVVSSTLMIIFTKPLAQKIFKNKDDTKMNSDSLIGKTGLVVKEIYNLESRGQIKINGELWSAFSSNPAQIIEEGAVVVIEDIEGVKLKVKRI